MNRTPFSFSTAARCGGIDVLVPALREARARTLGLLEAYVAALGPDLRVPYAAELNPPLWEAGHIAWFHDIWIARNRQRDRGITCEPDHPRPEGRLPGADALYDSSRVAHATRWDLPLPNLEATRDYLAASLEETLALLATTDETDDALYFFRLGLFHEDMHAEAAVYMAQTLDIPLPPSLRPAPATLPAARDLDIPAATHRLGYAGPGFAFDNELPAHDLQLADYAIDSVAVSWGRFLPAVEAGAVSCPRTLRRTDAGWQAWRYGVWEAVNPDHAAIHLTWGQARDWCRWAGRRLPTEAEWAHAAMTQADFAWGEAWEWTISRFVPFTGFAAHPYRDYSRFGFEEYRYVLKGASRAASPRMAHPAYRNFFTPDRDDVHTGFRSCRA